MVSDLLASWRYDPVPVGDVGWAVVEARQGLPASVQPVEFPLLGEGRTQSSQREGDIVRTTQAEVQGETVVATSTYRLQWWRFEARPNGEIVLMEEN